jgi:hypothetical protein
MYLLKTNGSGDSISIIMRAYFTIRTELQLANQKPRGHLIEILYCFAYSLF